MNIGILTILKTVSKTTSGLFANHPVVCCLYADVQSSILNLDGYR